ncbi:MAG: PQQ-like beta-propeller repeat protein [Planctomycetes bacterium]|nr:PQQ-like beta-propeller repeat protein [Planctomycetota bacterium]
MTRAVIVAMLLLLQPFPTLTAEEPLNATEQWGQWRGPLGTGVAPRGNPPVTWSEDKNIRWKISIPGKGHSTPIVWGDHIFITTAIPYGEAFAPRHQHAFGAHNNVSALRRQKYVVLAINRRDGTILWQRTVRTERPHESTHETGSWASNSTVTDGEHLFASFGSGGLYCLDMDGKLLWRTDFGDMQTLHGHGEGSSPALYGDSLIVNWDHQGESFVTALNKHTGKQRWKVARDEGTSWSTPLVVEHEGRPQVIIAATKRVRAYDLATGDIIWECGGLSGNVIASPVAAEGFVYVANSYETRAMLAIRLSAAEGDITTTDAVVWTRDRHTPYVPSPLLYGGMLYYLKHYQGFLTCVQAKTGKLLFGPERLAGIGNVFASLVGAADRVYIVSRNGTTAVIRRSAEFQLLALNHLDDSFSASPAIVGHELYLRGERYLYCITEEPAD